MHLVMCMEQHRRLLPREIVLLSGLSCHGSLAFCVTKLEKEMAFVICNVSITL